MPESTHLGGTTPRVVARRWDQLGARLTTIVNAASLAEVLGLDSGFVWPRGPDTAINRPADIFDRAFLGRFEIGAEALDERPPIPDYELAALGEDEVRRRLAADPRSFIEVHQLFDIVRMAWEDPPTARARFARCWSGLGWNDDARELMGTCARVAGERRLAAVHARAGDIVEGDWRQVIVHEKYVPTPFIEHAIDVLGAEGAVLVLSDNPWYLGRLRRRFPGTVTAAELVPGYERLSEIHQALADIVLLAGCRTIVGPPSSAFSRLGANLGPGAVVRADALAPAGAELRFLLAGIAECVGDAPGPEARRLLARDICWCLDVFSDELSLGERLRLARQATELDRDFSGAHARLARLAALAGDGTGAGAASARAMAIAEPVERYADALFEALATDIVVRCLGVVRTAPRLREWLGDHREPRLREVEEQYAHCRTLQPFWCVRERAWATLETLIDLARRCQAQPVPVRRRIARAATRNPEPAGEPFGGLGSHRTATIYDPLTRDLDRIVAGLRVTLAPLMGAHDG